jgi:hypothetical protein
MSKFEELELIEAGQDRTAARTATEGHSLAGAVRRQEGRASVWVVGRMLPLLICLHFRSALADEPLPLRLIFAKAE